MIAIRIISLLLFVVSSSMVFADIKPKININNNQNIKIFNKSTPKLDDKIENKRTQFYPTHVIRLKGNFDAYNLSCDDLGNIIDENFSVFYNLKDIMMEVFGWAQCGSVENSDRAQNFAFWVQIDALSDEAINTLQNIIAQKNGTDFYGQTIDVEEVQGIVASVDLFVGNFIPPQDQAINVDLHLNHKLYFNSSVDMQFGFLDEIRPNLFSTNTDLVKSFLTKWIIEKDYDDYFLNLITNSNYIELHTEPMFLFKKEPRVENSYSYAYACSKTKKGVCKSIPSMPHG